MKTARKFDCVKMKNEIQARLSREWKGLTGEQIQERIHRELATSNSPVARLWRSLLKRESASKP